MDETLHAALAPWGNFYLITGSAAAALTGLQFVVQTLLASESIRTVTGDHPEDGIEAFGTPTVVHFTLALVVSAMLCIPWPSHASLRGAIGLVGVGAVVYSVIVMRRARRQRAYAPVLEDWLWHVVLPGAAYAAIVGGAAMFESWTTTSHFLIAAATLVLLCVGIHNAWDTVTYLSIAMMRGVHPTEVGAPARREKKKSRGRRR